MATQSTTVDMEEVDKAVSSRNYRRRESVDDSPFTGGSRIDSVATATLLLSLDEKDPFVQPSLAALRARVVHKQDVNLSSDTRLAPLPVPTTTMAGAVPSIERLLQAMSPPWWPNLGTLLCMLAAALIAGVFILLFIIQYQSRVPPQIAVYVIISVFVLLIFSCIAAILKMNRFLFMALMRSYQTWFLLINSVVFHTMRMVKNDNPVLVANVARAWNVAPWVAYLQHIMQGITMSLWSFVLIMVDALPFLPRRAKAAAFAVWLLNFIYIYFAMIFDATMSATYSLPPFPILIFFSVFLINLTFGGDSEHLVALTSRLHLAVLIIEPKAPVTHESYIESLPAIEEPPQLAREPSLRPPVDPAVSRQASRSAQPTMSRQASARTQPTASDGAMILPNPLNDKLALIKSGEDDLANVVDRLRSTSKTTDSLSSTNFASSLSSHRLLEDLENSVDIDDSPSSDQSDADISPSSFSEPANDIGLGSSLMRTLREAPLARPISIARPMMSVAAPVAGRGKAGKNGKLDASNNDEPTDSAAAAFVKITMTFDSNDGGGNSEDGTRINNLDHDDNTLSLRPEFTAQYSIEARPYRPLIDLPWVAQFFLRRSRLTIIPYFLFCLAMLIFFGVQYMPHEPWHFVISVPFALLSTVPLLSMPDRYFTRQLMGNFEFRFLMFQVCVFIISSGTQVFFELDSHCEQDNLTPPCDLLVPLPIRYGTLIVRYYLFASLAFVSLIVDAYPVRPWFKGSLVMFSFINFLRYFIVWNFVEDDERWWRPKSFSVGYFTTDTHAVRLQAVLSLLFFTVKNLVSLYRFPQACVLLKAPLVKEVAEELDRPRAKSLRTLWVQREDNNGAGVGLMETAEYQPIQD